MKKQSICLFVAGAALSAPVFATNGMAMPGYGPVASSLGGAAAAYDNGAAGMINNPATIGFMEPNSRRFEIALGNLMPDAASQGQSSAADSFLMPAFGYLRRYERLTWGVGMMAQGGMGTDYANSSAFGPLSGMNFTNQTGYGVTDPGLQNKSEVGVGRIMFPLTWSVSPQLNIGASLDYVWAGMDIKWLIDGSHFASFMPLPGATYPFGAVSGSMVAAFGGRIGIGPGQITSVDYGYFDFDRGGQFKQKAEGSGWAANLGFTYQMTPRLSVGGMYHAKTHLSDLETGGNDATLSFAVQAVQPNGQPASMTIPVTGKVTVVDFQWPETWGVGFAWQADDQWRIVGDYKRIKWSDTMQNFNMTFSASGAASNGGFANSSMNMTLKQFWSDQEVFQIGAAYKANDKVEVRFGYNYAKNPIPDQYVSPLFPAVMEHHYACGVGYALSPNSGIDASLTYSPKNTVTNNWSAAGGANQQISLGGIGWQVSYNHRF